MRIFFHKYKTSLIAVVALALTVTALVCAAWYLSVIIRQRAVALKHAKMDYAVMQKDVRDIGMFRDDATYIRDHEDIFHIIVPNNDDDKIRLFATIERLTQESGGRDVALTVRDSVAALPTTFATTPQKTADAPVVAPSHPQHLFMTVSVTGTYEQILTFMSKLESMTMMADIVRVRLVKQTAADLLRTSSAPPRATLSDNATAPPAHMDGIVAEMDIVFYLK